MPPIPLPRPIPFSPFVPDPTARTFSQIFADTMGNLGTPNDGFDALFAQLTGLTDSVAPIADLDPGDVSLLADLAAGFAAPSEGDLALAIQPASDQTDQALSAYGVLVPPTANPQPPVGQPGGTPPPPKPPGPQAGDCEPGLATDFPNVPAASIQCVPDTLLGANPSGVYLGHSLANPPVGTPPIYFSAALASGDPAIWSITTTPTQYPGSGVDTTFHLQATPARTGRFLASVLVKFSQADPGRLQYFVTRVI